MTGVLRRARTVASFAFGERTGASRGVSDSDSEASDALPDIGTQELFTEWGPLVATMASGDVIGGLTLLDDQPGHTSRSPGSQHGQRSSSGGGGAVASRRVALQDGGDRAQSKRRLRRVTAVARTRCFVLEVPAAVHQDAASSAASVRHIHLCRRELEPDCATLRSLLRLCNQATSTIALWRQHPYMSRARAAVSGRRFDCYQVKFLKEFAAPHTSRQCRVSFMAEHLLALASTPAEERTPLATATLASELRRCAPVTMIDLLRNITRGLNILSAGN